MSGEQTLGWMMLSFTAGLFVGSVNSNQKGDAGDERRTAEKTAAFIVIRQ